MTRGGLAACFALLALLPLVYCDCSLPGYDLTPLANIGVFTVSGVYDTTSDDPASDVAYTFYVDPCARASGTPCDVDNVPYSVCMSITAAGKTWVNSSTVAAPGGDISVLPGNATGVQILLHGDHGMTCPDNNLRSTVRLELYCTFVGFASSLDAQSLYFVGLNESTCEFNFLAFDSSFCGDIAALNLNIGAYNATWLDSIVDGWQGYAIEVGIIFGAVIVGTIVCCAGVGVASYCCDCCRRGRGDAYVSAYKYGGRTGGINQGEYQRLQPVADGPPAGIGYNGYGPGRTTSTGPRDQWRSH